MPSEMTTESVEALAAGLWARLGFPMEHEWEELADDQRDDWRKDAQALVATGVVRLAGDVRGEALRETADEQDAMCDTYRDQMLPGLATRRAFADWLRDRAEAVVEIEGER